MFPTQYNRPISKYSNPGNRVHETYVGKYDEHGHMHLEKTGEEDIYDQIQSHKDSVDINVLMQRYKNGDETALSRVQGVFADVTGMPRTYAEMMNLVNDSTAAFESLPISVREKFNHNVMEFLQQSGTDVWYDKLGMMKPVSDSPSTGETVVPDVVKPEEVIS